MSRNCGLAFACPCSRTCRVCRRECSYYAAICGIHRDYLVDLGILRHEGVTRALS